MLPAGQARVGRASSQQVPQRHPKVSREGGRLPAIWPGYRPGRRVAPWDRRVQNTREAVVVVGGSRTQEGLCHNEADLPPGVTHVMPIFQLVTKPNLIGPRHRYLALMRCEWIGAAQELLLNPLGDEVLCHHPAAATTTLPEASVGPAGLLGEGELHGFFHGACRAGPCKCLGTLDTCDVSTDSFPLWRRLERCQRSNQKVHRHNETDRLPRR
mmetsp:Transcript_73255/g.202154  ORF Transcript_73255/g.202154 Transcript_73255/m.202154 type:complete len:213 (+) Transcript_73255:1470-2108(+)